MDKNNIVELEGREQIVDPVTQLLRNGARRLIEQTVEAELEQLLAAHAVRRTDDDKAGVVRNGYLPERPLQTNLGPVTVRIPKVRAKSGEPVTFRSALVPPYVRKTRTLEAALPWLYLKGGVQRRDERGTWCADWTASAGALGQCGITLKEGLGGRVSDLVQAATGQRSLGLCVG